MTWYKTTFKAPLGTDPIALDLQDLVEDDGCRANPCDYSGSYNNNKCVNNCGHLTQRWYRVPRSFINEGENTLVLFEEFGGDPSLINFRTVSIEKACAHTYENSNLELSCQGRPILEISFASFGNSSGTCGAFSKGTCKSQNDAVKIVADLCIGKESCFVFVSETIFGATNCSVDSAKRLVVEAFC